MMTMPAQDGEFSGGEVLGDITDHIASLTSLEAASFLLSLPIDEQPRVFHEVWTGDNITARSNLCSGLDSLPAKQLSPQAHDAILYSFKHIEQAS